ncbi:GNAT family N-acetyltransferase [Nocardia huaxiensis]|uniref:N-acetyltransferase n=1 Tax=Nocardia huaxiensis TaxID=2755382 RepID=A0A7D6ZHV1_9NOCA|nr:GNAT family N-acetyltransferase [Nocardia huaxiensis]QLY30907.1 N-acetyltransferase [Nocardia huaxiensis]UFS94418.1 N-acetyltransferase [Nocardia huaxiensis]
MPSETIEVRKNSALDRFELYVDGYLAGVASYQDTASERAFVHTEIYPQHEGLGYGRKLVQGALDQTRSEGLGILPMCPMVHHFVESRPDYLALVPQWSRGRLGLPQA